MLRVLTGSAMEHDYAPVVVACLIVGLIIGLGAVALVYRRRDARSRLVELALNNMTQGVVMFDAAGRLAVCNARYLAIYDLPPDVVKPGARLIDIVRLRAKS